MCPVRTWVVEEDKLKYFLTAYANSVYYLDKMYLEIHLRLVDVSTGTTPRNGDLVGKPSVGGGRWLFSLILSLLFLRASEQPRKFPVL
jgi:hypothetical protein